MTALQIGMVGLGRMGGSMAERLRRRGHAVVGHDASPDVGDVEDLGELVDALAEPRVVWSMVPAGEATQRVVESLAARLGPRDVIVDGANSYFRDSMVRWEALAEQEVGFVDVGVSGGVWGLDEGYCLMVGGEARHVERVWPALEALAPEGGGLAHVGPPGAGHLTKMVHNGIEYGLMQAYAEGYELLRASDVDVDVPAALEAWRHGSVVRSWLLDLLVEALGDDPELSGVRGWADDSGEGRWTVEEAVNAAVPVPAISAALYARFASRQEDAPAMKVVAALRRRFGGHAVREG